MALQHALGANVVVYTLQLLQGLGWCFWCSMRIGISESPAKSHEKSSSAPDLRKFLEARPASLVRSPGGEIQGVEEGLPRTRCA